MPRIRTIKPEIWDSPDFMDLPAAGQLTFIALISLADDHGRLRGDARHVHLVALRQVPPEEIAQHLAQMERLGMVRCYVVEERPYAQLLNWSKHQKVDHAKDSVYPPPPSASPRDGSRRRAKPRDGSRATPEASRSVETSRAPADRIEDLGPVPEGIGSERAREVSEEVSERARQLDQNCQELLGRQTTAKERDVVLEWAELKRGGDPVPLEEIVNKATTEMQRRTPEGSLPASLTWARHSVLTLARGPANGPSVLFAGRSGDSAAYSAELRQMAEQARKEGR